MAYYMDRARSHRTFEVWTIVGGKPKLYKSGTFAAVHAAAERLTQRGKAAEIVQSGVSPYLITSVCNG